MKKPQAPIFSWMNPRLEVKKTSKYGKANLPTQKDGKKSYIKKSGEGFAIYAKEPIKKGTTLFVMGGYILDIDDENSLTGIVADKPIEVSEEFSIGPRKPSDIPKMPQHYVNHSCNPNAGFKGQIFMVAMKSIKAEEEIVYDYAMIMSPNEKSNSYFQFECLCGSKQCRKVIGEDDWKRKDLQERYDGYFQYFIQEKINKKKK
jgi:hypothetical protein